jgi:hypothetical protein
MAEFAHQQTTPVPLDRWNPLETALFERAGRNEVGGASPFHDDQTDCETSRRYRFEDGHL